MSEIPAYLRQFDDAWGHAWESIESVLEGMTQDEAFWQADAYAGEEAEEGWPSPGTIAWQVAHVAHCKRYYTIVVRHAGEPGRPDAEDWTSRPTYADLWAELRLAHRAQRKAIEALEEDRLDVEAGNGMSLREFLAMSIRHDTWHAAQIAVVRRLYRIRWPTPDAPR